MIFADIPREIDDFFYFQFFIVFLIGFAINVFTNGQATMIFMNETYNIVPLMNYSFHTQEYQVIQDFTNQVSWKSDFAKNLSLFFYFVLSPLVNFYYSIFVFKKNRFWDRPFFRF